MKIAPIKQKNNRIIRFGIKANNEEISASNLYNTLGCRIDEQGEIHISNPLKTTQTKTHQNEERRKKEEEARLRNELLYDVFKPAKEPLYRVINECYELSKKRFPGQKVTVFYNTVKRKHSSSARYIIAVGVNTDAQEGIIRNNEELPGFLASRNADFYYLKVLYSNTKDKMDYGKLRISVLQGLNDKIAEYRSKGKQDENK